MLRYVWGNLESLSCFLEVVSHRKHESSHLSYRFLVLNYLVDLLTDLIRLEVLRFCRHLKSVLEHGSTATDN